MGKGYVGVGSRLGSVRKGDGAIGFCRRSGKQSGEEVNNEQRIREELADRGQGKCHLPSLVMAGSRTA